MVSSQVLLAVGIAVPLILITGYVAWLGRRVAELERRADAPGTGDGDDPEEPNR